VNALYSSSDLQNGGFRNHVSWNSVKSATYQEGGPVGDITLRTCGSEPRRLTDGPIGQEPAAAAPVTPNFLLIDVTALSSSSTPIIKSL